MPRRAGATVLAVLMPLAGIAEGALAEPLAKEECDNLLAEQAKLSETGVREHLEHGAEWGKSNLSPPQLKSVERFILLEEQLSFRCGLAELRASLSESEESGEQEVDAKSVPLPVRPKQAQSPEAGAKHRTGSAPKGAAPAKSQSQPPAAKAASKAKTKVDDAYRPPRKDPDANPFAGKLPDQNK